MKKSKNGIPVVKVDATIEKRIADRFGVQGYPTLFLFRDGQPIEYQG